MIHDGRNVEPGQALKCDVCIIGAGAAGISIALALRESAGRVCLLESGGLEVEAATQELSRGANVGLPYLPLEVPRLRVLGGSTMHWGGFVAPLDAIDFERRSWVPHSGWPIDRTTLDAYYPLAQDLCDSGPFSYALKHWDDPEHRAFPFKGDRLTAALWQHSGPARFGTKYREALAAADNLDVFLHSNVVALETNATMDHLDGVAVKCLGGNSFRVESGAYVLACGGIENARILLASRTTDGGVANQSGCVGRFYAGHPRIDGVVEGFLGVPTARPMVYERIQSRFSKYSITANIRISDIAQRREGLVNTAFRLFFPDTPAGADESVSVPESTGSDSARRAVDALFRDLANQPGESSPTFILRSHAEPVPNPDSRVTLDTAVDDLGVPRVKLDWRLTSFDRDQLRRASQLVAQEFGRAGLGRMRTARWLEEQEPVWPSWMFGSWHHMGTTRMGANPAESVVNGDGRSHQVSNLYVAGSSVFPTFGWATPTLTIVALALRLADHLREKWLRQ